MTDISRGIRHAIEDHGGTLKGMNDEDIKDGITIIGAFLADFQAEAERRGLFDPPSRPRPDYDPHLDYPERYKEGPI